jgi:hypothetical protein
MLFGALNAGVEAAFCIVSTSIPDVCMRNRNTDYHPVADRAVNGLGTHPHWRARGMSESERTDLDVDDELDAVQVRRAQRVVAALSLDAADCRMLLSMLGIAGNPDAPESD